MSRAHFDLVDHVDLAGVFFVDGVLGLGYHLFAFVDPVGADILTSLIHEFHIYLAIRQILNIDYVGVRIVAAGEDHAGVRRNLQIEFIEYVFWFVDFAELFLEVLRNIQHFAWLILLAYVPDLDAQVITRK